MLLIGVILVILSGNLLSQVQISNDFTQLNYIDKQIEETNVFEADEILSVDEIGNFHIKTSSNISLIDSAGSKVWDRAISDDSRYFVRSSNRGEISIVFEQTEFGTTPKYIVDNNGEDHSVNFEYPRLSPSGKFIYQSNEHYYTSNYNVYNTEERLYIDFSNELESGDSNLERSIQLRLLSENIAALLIFEFNKPTSENPIRSLLAADLVLLSIIDREFILRHSLLIDPNNDEKSRFNKVNLNKDQMYLINDRFIFREILLDGSSKINIFDLNTRQFVFENIEQRLVDFTPSNNGLDILFLKVSNGGRRLTHMNTIDNNLIDIGQINGIRRIDDFRLSGNVITILQKSTLYENSDDLIIQKDIANNSTTTLRGKFSSVDLGIIKQNNQLFKISRNEK